jgi:hypothetical protein
MNLLEDAPACLLLSGSRPRRAAVNIGASAMRTMHRWRATVSTTQGDHGWGRAAGSADDAGARPEANPDFIGALARGLNVIQAFQPRQQVMSLAAVAAAASLPAGDAGQALAGPSRPGIAPRYQAGFRTEGVTRL